MATTLANLSAADRADFLGRLSKFGLTETAISTPDFEVPANTTVTLSAADSKSAVKPQILTTTNLDQLKTWIGIPDSLYNDSSLDRSRIALPKAPAPTARPTKAQLEDVQLAAYAYLFGDSQQTANYRTAVEEQFTNFQIIFWPFYTITVNSGSVLQIGPGQNVLSAWKIIIYPGGMVRGSGGLKTSATILQKM